MEVARNTFALTQEVRLHCAVAGEGPRTAVLLHGFPQTSHEWRKITPQLVAHGLKVVCPDYRGAGASSKPPAGYDKWTMAGDIQALLRQHLKVEGPVLLVGHDIGAMIALAFALRFRSEVAQLVLIDAPPEDFDVYVRAYEAAGAMRAGFEAYRAFDADAATVKRAIAESGKLQIPVMSIAGAGSGLDKWMPAMLREVAEQTRHETAPRSGHGVPEENPQFASDAILRFAAL
ncbi:MAG: Soluble epoxide hydrolase [Gammaproteobacteria bacterium]|nr:Soluble epoxide hydrolase [Gammaproteobacteria bacterium]